jgi:cytochrome c oxidase subunit 2
MSGSLQSALDSAGPQAARIEHLWWVFLGVCSLVYVLVLVFLALALRRGRRGKGTVPGSERRLTRIVATATAASVVTLFILLTADVTTGRALSRHGDPEALHIKVTGHQWWWQVQYQEGSPDQQFETANEIHIPVGRPVVFSLTSTDVIHSFWVPSLHGKMDLIPTHQNTLWLRADRAGTFRGQCAEFCGLQHAHMKLLVVAEPPAAFEAWRRAQTEPGRTPDTPEEKQGQAVFTSLPCALCHRIRGTPAGGRTGPDLTHLAARRTIAAGTLPNTRGHLAAWILDPQGIKPGNPMPPNLVSAADLQAMLTYLGSLQ